MMHRRKAGLGLGAPSAAALLAAAFVAGCGGGGGGSGEAAQPAPNEARLSTTQPGDVVAFFKAKIAQRAALGLNGTAITVPTVGGAATAGSVVVHAGVSQTDPGVEEDNLLKSEGSMVYAAHRGYGQGAEAQPPRLAALSRLADGSLQSIGRVPLDPQYVPSGLVLAGTGTRVAVLSQEDPYYGRQTVNPQIAPEYSRKLSLDVYTASAGTAPAPLKRLRIDGLLLGSRQIGNTLYVASTWSPDLTRFSVPAGSTASQVQTALAGLDAAALLPKVQVDAGAAQPLVNESDCLVHPDNASLALQITTITAIDLASGDLNRASRCFAGGSEGLFFGAASIYVASSRQYRYGSDVPATVFPAGSRTDIHKFALKPGQIDYRASNSVEGHLGWDATRIAQRLSEYQGDLRVQTFTGDIGQSGQLPVTIQSKPAQPALLHVLRENTSERSLTRLATLPNTQRTAPLVPSGQQLDVLHFVGPRAYALSLNRASALKVVDLANPAEPGLAGELPGAGYADHLYALPNGLLLGVGKDTSVGGLADGIQVALFDARNAADPKRITADALGGRGSITALDVARQALHIQTQGARTRIAFPARVYESASTAYQGAARFEVDTTALTLTALPTLTSTAITPELADLETRYKLANERTLQPAVNALYYTSGGLTYYLVQN
jgi:hypothetical protein